MKANVFIILAALVLSCEGVPQFQDFERVLIPDLQELKANSKILKATTPKQNPKVPASNSEGSNEALQGGEPANNPSAQQKRALRNQQNLEDQTLVKEHIEARLEENFPASAQPLGLLSDQQNQLEQVQSGRGFPQNSMSTSEIKPEQAHLLPQQETGQYANQQKQQFLQEQPLPNEDSLGVPPSKNPNDNGDQDDSKNKEKPPSLLNDTNVNWLDKKTTPHAPTPSISPQSTQNKKSTKRQQNTRKYSTFSPKLGRAMERVDESISLKEGEDKKNSSCRPFHTTSLTLLLGGSMTTLILTL